MNTSCLGILCLFVSLFVCLFIYLPTYFGCIIVCLTGKRRVGCKRKAKKREEYTRREGNYRKRKAIEIISTHIHNHIMSVRLSVTDKK